MKKGSILCFWMVCAFFEPTSGQSRNPLLLLADSAYEAGKFAESARLYESAIRSGAKGAVVYYNTSCSFARAGNKEKALRYLEQAVDGGWRNVDRMQKDSDFVNLRSDARWAATLRKAQAAKEQYDHLQSIVAHLNVLSAAANQYRNLPKTAGGGDGTYLGYLVPPKLASSPEASFSATVVSRNIVEFVGTSELGHGTISAKLDAKGRVFNWVYAGEFKKMTKKELR